MVILCYDILLAEIQDGEHILKKKEDIRALAISKFDMSLEGNNHQKTNCDLLFYCYLDIK